MHLHPDTIAPSPSIPVEPCPTCGGSLFKIERHMSGRVAALCLKCAPSGPQEIADDAIQTPPANRPWYWNFIPPLTRPK